MAELLAVPVSLAALCLAEETAVVEPPDFSRLPYVDPGSGLDIQPGAPYLSEQILPLPFDDQNLWLKPGVHLHWSLPDALTKLVQTNGTTHVPAVPDRWLVTRSRGGTIERQWVVESDYLAPADDPSGGITFPVPGAAVPYRRLGRQMPLATWRPDLPGDRLAEVTAIGHGDPAFAALYPYCHSVFGLYDADFTGTPPAGTLYEVTGWYADPRQDPVAGLGDGDNGDGDGDDRRDVLSDVFGWGVPQNSSKPDSMVCYGALGFKPDGGEVSPLIAVGDSGVCMGTTATEALAAHLGTVLDVGAPDEIENLLEALSYADELEAKPLDVGVKLAEERHADGFRPVPSGTLWTIKRVDDPDVEPSARERREGLTLPHEIGDLLNLLNIAQEDSDRAGNDLVSMREQLFADWYKYMLCAYPYDPLDTYPDPDEVRHYLERRMGLLAGETARAADLDAAVTRAHATLQAALDAFTTSTAAAYGAGYRLDTVAAPVYYLPAEPVVLLTGDAATPSDRHGQDGAGEPDGLLPCAIVTTDPRDPAKLRQDLYEAGLQVATWLSPSWHPIMLQWEVEFFPAGLGDNLDPSDPAYDATYVTGNHALDGVELRPRPGRDTPDKAANVYSGSTVLSRSARPVMSARILRYLAGTIVPAYNEANEPPDSPADFQDAPETVLTWYTTHGDDARLTTLVAIYRHLAEHESANLAQVLGGFNDALLMRRLTRQLPIADPLGFPGYQRFAAQVAETVGDDTRHAPQPLSDFNPVRAGALRVRRLRIVDNFGLTFDVDAANPATTAQLRIDDRPGWVAMPPRLPQPSRVAFRWLDSDHEIREMNDVPSTSPICGWLVPDDLDDAVAFFAGDGTALGLLMAEPQPGSPARARWQTAPGGTITAVEQITNPHLRAVAIRLQALGADALGDFVAGLDDLTAGIEPEDHSLGVLTARPLAVLRAELDLQLMGLPAVHQDWNVFRQDMRRTTRDTNGFSLVEFAVRVGAADRLNDGLVGRWPEDAAGVLGDFVPATADAPVTLALDSPPVRCTLLTDPRAPVHVVSGVLPAKTLGLPAEQYRATMDGLRLPTFTAPVLLDGDSLAVPVPEVAGHGWTWRVDEPSGWSDRPVEAVRDDVTLPTVPTAHEGWLTLVPLPDSE